MIEVARSIWRKEVEHGRRKGLTPDEAAHEAYQRLNNGPKIIGHRGRTGPSALNIDRCPHCGDTRTLSPERCGNCGRHAGSDN